MNTLVAALCYVLAVAVAVLAVSMSIALVSEYGDAEGYGNLVLQVFPIVAVGLLLAGGLGWAGARLMRRRAR